MDLQDGSVPHLSRLPRAISSLPGPRGKDTLTTRPSQSATTRNLVGPRRKRTTDQAFSTDKDFIHGENKRILRPRTISSTNIESRNLRPTKAKKPPTGSLAGDERTPLSIITSAGAPWKHPKSQIPRRVTASVADNSTNKLRNTGEDTARNPASHPHPTFPSAILNVGLFDVASKTATPPTSYLSFNALDDLSRWDMDSLPSIPSPPASPECGSLDTNSRTPPLVNPFIDPIDDDALLENEIPFPLNRHSNVIHENMGVKKSKNVARERRISGSMVTHIGIRPGPPLPPPSDHTLPGLPHPLPLQTLCQNKTTSNLLPVASSPRAYTTTTSTPSPKVTPGPSPSYVDSRGHVHLGAANCELSIAFPHTSHYEFWDMGDDSYVACPVLLCLTVKDAHPWFGRPLALPEVTLFDIRCEDIPLPSRMSVYNPTDEYSTHYTGSKIPSPRNHPLLDATPPTRVGRDEITIEAKWVQTSSKPGVAGPIVSSSHMHTGTHPRPTVTDTTTDVARHAPSNAPSAHQHVAARASAGGARGWYLKFWVPVPTRLFAKRETRVFRLGARVWMMGDEERGLSLDEAADGRAYPLFAEAQMSVTHLRTPREMGDY